MVTLVPIDYTILGFMPVCRPSQPGHLAAVLSAKKKFRWVVSIGAYG